MKIKFKEQKAIEIIQYNKSIEYDISCVNKIYIKHFSFLLIKMYYLNIITKDRKKNSFLFFRKDKENIKREVFYIRNFMSSHLE
jgi:hypothetical protein